MAHVTYRPFIEINRMFVHRVSNNLQQNGQYENKLAGTHLISINFKRFSTAPKVAKFLISVEIVIFGHYLDIRQIWKPTDFNQN